MDLKLLAAIALSTAALISLAAEQSPTAANPVAVHAVMRPAVEHVGPPTLRPQLHQVTTLRVPIDAPIFEASHPAPRSAPRRRVASTSACGSACNFVPGEPWRNWARAWWCDGPFPVARAAVRVTARNWPGPIACWWRCRLRCR